MTHLLKAEQTAALSLIPSATLSVCSGSELKEKPVSELQSVGLTLLSMQLSMLIYKQGSQQEPLTWLIS